MRPTSLRRAAAVVLIGATLAACGGGEPGATAQSASPGATASEVQTSAEPGVETSAGAEPSIESRASIEAGVEASTIAGAAASAGAEARIAADGPYAGLPRSTTPEGYYVLGDPAAPVTLTFYSDFI